MILIIIVPVVVAISLCMLQPGRQAAAGIGIATALLAILWVASGGEQDQGLTSTYALMAARVSLWRRLPISPIVSLARSCRSGAMLWRQLRFFLRFRPSCAH